MKVFVINLTAKDIILELKNKGVEILYWTIRNQERFDEISQDKANFPKTIFHSSFDAFLGVPAPALAGQKFSPPPKEVFDYLLKCESQAITMMARADYDDLSIDYWKNLYHEYIIYWYGVLKLLQPDAILFWDIPHSVFNFVLYWLAKYLKIKTIMFKRAKGVPDGLLFFNDYQDYKNQELANVRDKLEKENFQFSDLGEEMKKYYLKQKGSADKSTPLLDKETLTYNIPRKIKGSEVFPGWSVAIKNLKEGTFWRHGLSYFRLMLKRERLLSLKTQYFRGWQLRILRCQWQKTRDSFKREYQRLQQPADLSKKFIYVPLHLQPECATNPLGDLFNDQILVLKMLAAALPDDWQIYVKENPAQWIDPQGHLGRYGGYYEKIAKISRVTLVPIKTSTYELIGQCQAVATVTGMAGWEALLRSKPVLVFGYTWYAPCEGVFRVNSTAEVGSAFDRIKSGYLPDENKVIAFLGALEKVMVRGYSSKRFSQFSKVSPEENAKNVAEAFYRELKK